MNHQEIKIITYHYVRNAKDGDWPNLKALTVRDFERQIEWISKNGVVINSDKLIRVIAGEEELSPESYLLTFDDGYADHAENAMPVLRRYGMTGVFFLPIKAIVERDMLAANKIQHILGGTHDVKEVTRKVISALSEYREEYDLKSDEEYWQSCAKEGRFDGLEVKYVKNMLQFELPEPVRRNILDDLFSEYVSSDQETFADELYLGIDEVQKIKEMGMEIQSHGYEHVRWKLLTKDEQEEDTRKAFREFNKLGIDKSDWTMCYPYGSYNDDTEEVLRRFGCKAGFTTLGGVTNIGEVGQFAINRMDTTELITELNERSLKLGQV